MLSELAHLLSLAEIVDLILCNRVVIHLGLLLLCISANLCCGHDLLCRPEARQVRAVHLHKRP